MADGATELVARLDERGCEALEEFLACVRESWTGKLTFHFRDGQPQMATRDPTVRFNGDSTGNLTLEP